MRTMKRLSFNRTHRIQSKSSSPIALVMPKRSDHSRTHFHRTCVVGLFRTRFLCALLHANFSNARPIGLSQRLPNKLFCIHFHSTSHKSLHGKPERADAAQTMSRFCKKWQKFAVVNGPSTPKRPQRCFVFCKTPGHDLPEAGTMRSPWVCKIVCVSPLKGQRLRRRSSPAQGAGHATMAAAWPAADWRRP